MIRPPVNDRPVRTALGPTASPGWFLFHVKHWRGSKPMSSC